MKYDRPAGYAQIDWDDEALEDLLVVVNPTPQDKVTLGALTNRYAYPHPLAILAQDVHEGWGLTQEQLHKECRQIWASGFRPQATDYGVGSANDLNNTEESQ